MQKFRITSVSASEEMANRPPSILKTLVRRRRVLGYNPSAAQASDGSECFPSAAVAL